MNFLQKECVHVQARAFVLNQFYILEDTPSKYIPTINLSKYFVEETK